MFPALREPETDCNLAVRSRPGSLVTLMAILEVKADAFCRLSSMIGQMIIALAQNWTTEMGAVAGTLGELQREAQRLDLRSVDQHLSRIYESIKPGMTNQVMHGMVVELYNRMLDELNDRFFLSISAEDVKHYRQSEPLFGKDVEAKFPEMSEDIAEAGKCLALERPTAAVFHLMRTMEIAVQRFGDKLGIRLASEKNWQNILDEMNKAIKALDQKAAQTKAYAEASALLYNVKLCWRNAVMHPKQTYTTEEARALLNAVSVFIRDLAGIL